MTSGGGMVGPIAPSGIKQDQWLSDVDQVSDVQLMEIVSLLPADSPRLFGEDVVHARRLAESEGELPPILVHRQTMRVIDGMHRLAAAVLRGEDRIRARLYEGAVEDAFVLAVEANIAHGLPLTRADREAAVLRIINTHPQWSDRIVAARTGLSGKTVSAIRRRSTARIPQSNARLGSDGRVRPLNGAEGRWRASEVIAARPGTPLREVARTAGIAVSTAHDVRERMRRGEDPVPAKLRVEAEDPGQRDRAVPHGNVTESRLAEIDFMARLDVLNRDPSLRISESGRRILRLLNTHAAISAQWKYLMDDIPPHCMNTLVEFAIGYAASWHVFADELNRRIGSSSV